MHPKSKRTNVDIMVKSSTKKPGKPKGPVNSLLARFYTKKSLASFKEDNSKTLGHPDKDQLNIFLYRGLRKIMKSRINKSQSQIKKLMIDTTKKFYQKFEDEIDPLFWDTQSVNLTKINEIIKGPKPDFGKSGKSKVSKKINTGDHETLEKFEGKNERNAGGSISNKDELKSHNGKCMQMFYEHTNVQKLYKIVVRYLRKVVEKDLFINSFNFICCTKRKHGDYCKKLWNELLDFLDRDYFPSLNIKTLSFRNVETEEPCEMFKDDAYSDLDLNVLK
jgi:hypothetical protein